MTDRNAAAAKLRENLPYFTGTTRWFRHWTRTLLYTEGVEYLAETAGAYWLIDAIASYQPRLQRDAELRDFQLWTLTLDLEASGAVLECRADSDREPAVRQEIPYTDFPLEEIRLYVEPSEAGPVLLLPSER